MTACFEASERFDDAIGASAAALLGPDRLAKLDALVAEVAPRYVDAVALRALGIALAQPRSTSTPALARSLGLPYRGLAPQILRGRRLAHRLGLADRLTVALGLGNSDRWIEARLARDRTGRRPFVLNVAETVIWTSPGHHPVYP